MSRPKSPPPVAYPLGQRRSLAVVLCGVPLLGAVVGTLWALHVFPGEQAGVLQVLGWLLSLGLAVACAFWLWKSQKPGALAWNGVQWRWLDELGAPFDAGRLCDQVEVRADWQHILLLRVRWRAANGQGRARVAWFWLDKSHDRRAWHLLRCAVYFNPVQSPGPSLT